MNSDAADHTSTAMQQHQQQQQQQAEERWARIAAMRRQEVNGYRTSNDMYDNLDDEDMDDYASCLLLEDMSTMPVDKDCRDKMAQWTFQMVDFLKFNRETAVLSLSLLDRFMMTGAAPSADRRLFQLASMTSLYTTVKIHEPVAMDPQLVSTLSQGMYTAAEVQAMEATMLFAVSWRVNPPTALAFVRECTQLLLLLLPDNSSGTVLDEETVRAVYDLCSIQTQVAAREYAFLGIPASTVAYCSLLNALQSVVLVNDAQLAKVASVLARALLGGIEGAVANNQHNNNGKMDKIRTLLYEASLAYETAAAAGMRAMTAADGGNSSDSCSRQEMNNNSKRQYSQQQQHKTSPRSAMTMS